MKVLKYRQELRLQMLVGASKNWKMVNIKKVEAYLALVYHIDTNYFIVCFYNKEQAALYCKYSLFFSVLPYWGMLLNTF